MLIQHQNKNNIIQYRESNMFIGFNGVLTSCKKKISYNKDKKLVIEKLIGMGFSEEKTKEIEGFLRAMITNIIESELQTYE